MNEIVKVWRSAYGPDWMHVLNRRSGMRDDLTKVETAAAFMWGREAAQMLGMDKDRE